MNPAQTKTARWSYLAIPAALLLVGVLHLGVLIIALLFSYFALEQFGRFLRGRKWWAVALFVIVAAALIYGIGYFIRQAARELPDIVDNSVPAITTWAQAHGVTIPFTDYDSLKDLVISTAKSEAQYLGEAARLARGAAAEMVHVLVGMFIAITMYIGFAGRKTSAHTAANLHEQVSDELTLRFAAFYESFALIMGAQLLIAIINSILTLVFVLVTGLPHAVVVVGVTFLCGLLPVVGNLVSNCIMVCIAFTVSPRLALIALVFLVVVHKMEYILNSKIIGSRAHLPIWLTLVALILGEKLMGVTGMILAPVLLLYFRTEAQRLPPE